MSDDRSVTGIELFAGAGGLALGLAEAGVKHLALLDHDSHTCRMLTSNAERLLIDGKDSVIETDVSDYDFHSLPGKIDFVSGGPPCQPFSSGGDHKGHLDSRDMFPQAIRAVREIRPKAFLFENVAGLYRGRFNDYREYIKLQLEHPALTVREHESWWEHRERLREAHLSRAAEYRVVLKDDVNAADFGAPQRRERILFLGIRSDMPVTPKLPRPTHSEAALLHDQWVTGDYWERHDIATSDRPVKPSKLPSSEELLLQSGDRSPWVTLRQALGDLPPMGDNDQVSGHFLIPGARSYPGHDGSTWDWVAKALKAGVHGVPGGENCVRLSGGGVRYFTLRECARIQGIGDEYILGGPWTRTMKALGNAVPVPVGQAFGASLVEAIA